MSRYHLAPIAAEFVGTFSFIFCGTGAIAVDHLYGGRIGLTGIALAFGAGIMVMVYTFGPVSGAHFNPAVSLAFLILGKISPRKFFTFALVQLTAAVLASLALAFVLQDRSHLGPTLSSLSPERTVLLEALLTFLLLVVIFPVSENPNRFAVSGLAIGTTVALAAIFAGPLTGASLNPARSFGPALVSGKMNDLAFYFLGPCAGAASAAFIWKIIRR